MENVRIKQFCDLSVRTKFMCVVLRQDETPVLRGLAMRKVAERLADYCDPPKTTVAIGSNELVMEFQDNK